MVSHLTPLALIRKRHRYRLFVNIQARVDNKSSRLLSPCTRLCVRVVSVNVVEIDL